MNTEFTSELLSAIQVNGFVETNVSTNGNAKVIGLLSVTSSFVKRYTSAFNKAVVGCGLDSGDASIEQIFDKQAIANLQVSTFATSEKVQKSFAKQVQTWLKSVTGKEILLSDTDNRLVLSLMLEFLDKSFNDYSSTKSEQRQKVAKSLGFRNVVTRVYDAVKQQVAKDAIERFNSIDHLISVTKDEGILPCIVRQSFVTFGLSFTKDELIEIEGLIAKRKVAQLDAITSKEKQKVTQAVTATA